MIQSANDYPLIIMNTSSTTAPASGVNVLPLPPAITPAIGIAGGILILTGLGYGLIGIKHRLWVETLCFASTQTDFRAVYTYSSAALT